jgi:hypothetical protein
LHVLEPFRAGAHWRRVRPEAVDAYARRILLNGFLSGGRAAGREPGDGRAPERPAHDTPEQIRTRLACVIGDPVRSRRFSAPGWMALVTTDNSGVLRHSPAGAEPTPPLTAAQAADVALTRGLIP